MLQKQPPANIAVWGFSESFDMGAAITDTAAAAANSATNNVILFIEATSS
jgi:hypothetical protein